MGRYTFNTLLQRFEEQKKRFVALFLFCYPQKRKGVSELFFADKPNGWVNAISPANFADN